jgi:hypothetical protein
VRCGTRSRTGAYALHALGGVHCAGNHEAPETTDGTGRDGAAGGCWLLASSAPHPWSCNQLRVARPTNSGSPWQCADAFMYNLSMASPLQLHILISRTLSVCCSGALKRASTLTELAKLKQAHEISGTLIVQNNLVMNWRWARNTRSVLCTP